MKKFLYRVDCIALLLVCMLFAGGCNRPSEISDSELEDIFRDIYIANAFKQINYYGVDTIDLYAPILESYGYDIDDFNSTMLGFTKRKNSKLLLIIEAAIRQLDRKFYSIEDRIAVLDTVEARSRRKLQSVLIDNQRIEVNSIKDTTQLLIELDAREGSYFISYVYEVDSLDKNKSYLATHILEDSVGNNIRYDSHRFGKLRKRYSAEMSANPRVKKLVLNLGNLKKKMKRPYLTIDSLRVVYRLPGRVALDSINNVLTDKLFTSGTKWPNYPIYPQDSISLHLPPTGVSPSGGDNTK